MNFSCRLFFLILLLALAGGNISHAQKSDEAAPTPPFVVNAPQEGGWHIVFNFKHGLPQPTDKASSAYAQWQQWKSASPAISEILVSKSNKRQRSITKFMSGSQNEQYRVGDTLFLQKAGFAAGDILIMPSPDHGNDFPELSWLSAADYIDTESANGNKYFVFRNASGGMEAWIDTGTHLPFKFNDALYDRTYEFSAVPPISIEPSELIAKRVALHDAN